MSINLTNKKKELYFMHSRQGKSGVNRRQYERFNLKCRLKYQVTLEGALSEINFCDTKNISQGGFLLNVNWPLPINSTLAIEFNSNILSKYIDINRLKNCVEIEQTNFNIIRLFGTVLRCHKQDDGSYDIGVLLLNKEENYAE